MNHISATPLPHEYSRKGRMAKYEKFNRRGFNDRGYDDRFNGYNGRRFNDRFADRKKELPPDVYFPNKDKTFPRDNPYGRGDGYRDRMPYDRLPLRDDVYRPGKPYGQMRGSIHYQGGYDRFPDRGGYGRELLGLGWGTTVPEHPMIRFVSHVRSLKRSSQPSPHAPTRPDPTVAALPPPVTVTHETYPAAPTTDDSADRHPDDLSVHPHHQD